jgi:zinc transport system permease protein
VRRVLAWGLLLALAVLACLAIALGWLDTAGDWLHRTVERLGPASYFGFGFMLRAFLGVVLVSLLCGIISSLVVSNRMAFFSDALAHCAFAGVALGWILYFVEYVADDDGILVVMIVFGMLVGLLIAYVREQTSLANDTVIGVFFAGAMGLGAVLLKAISRIRMGGSRFSPENFLFGDILTVTGKDLLYLFLLLAGTMAFLCWMYNRLVFISFNPSLARSRNFPVRLANYLFIILLALVVNICLKIVGALLINALLVLPGATAANISRNLRQFFWLSAAVAVAAGVGGVILSDAWVPQVGAYRIDLISGGTVVMIGVVLFFASVFYKSWVRSARGTLRTGY